MKVLIACEFSGTVRDAFIKYGNDAVSCDLLPSLSDKGRHIQGDVLDAIKSERWDLMIAHPPCTYLSVVGNRAMKEQGDARLKERDAAFKFALTLFNAPIPKICMENPVGYLNTHFRKPDQIIHPWMFGDDIMKRTCLWLKNLPKLYWSVQYAQKPKPIYYRNGTPINWFEACRGSQNGLKRWQVRSKTFNGIADAMALQWGTEQTGYFFEQYDSHDDPKIQNFCAGDEV